jgi:hypothetical protein
MPYVKGHEPGVFAFGLRDFWQNLFKPGFIGGRRPLTLYRPGEPIEVRRYLALYSRRDQPGHLAIGWVRFDPKGGVEIEGENRAIAFCLAIAPLVSDGQIVPRETRVGYQADLRHEIHVPPERWKEILPQLKAALLSSTDPAECGAAILAKARALNLSMEKRYWLESFGIRRDGQLNLIAGQMSADEAAERQLAMESVAAGISQEGGSCGFSIWECEKDFEKADSILRDASGQPVWEAAPRYFGNNTYFRPNALALCVIKMKNFVTEPPLRNDRS